MNEIVLWQAVVSKVLFIKICLNPCLKQFSLASWSMSCICFLPLWIKGSVTVVLTFHNLFLILVVFVLEVLKHIPFTFPPFVGSGFWHNLQIAGLSLNCFQMTETFFRINSSSDPMCTFSLSPNLFTKQCFKHNLVQIYPAYANTSSHNYIVNITNITKNHRLLKYVTALIFNQFNSVLFI